MARPHFLICTALLLPCVFSFPLSQLFAPFNALTFDFASPVLRYPDGTLLISETLQPFAPGLSFHPQVDTSVRPPPFLSPTQVIARLEPRNSSILWARTLPGGADFSLEFVAIDANATAYAIRSVPFQDSFFSVLTYSPNGLFIGETPYNATSFPQFVDSPNTLVAATPRQRVRAFSPPGTIVKQADVTAGTGATVPLMFINTATGTARIVPLNAATEFGSDFVPEAYGVATDPGGSGITCGVGSINGPSMSQQTGPQTVPMALNVSCVRADGSDEPKLRRITEFEPDTRFRRPTALIAEGVNGGGTVLYVAVVRERGLTIDEILQTQSPGVSDNTLDLIVFKLSADTLEDLEWDTGAVSPSSTARSLRLPSPFVPYTGIDLLGVRATEFLPESNSFVVLYNAETELFGIQQVSEGEFAFTGDNSQAAIQNPPQQWVISFGGDPTPVAQKVAFTASDEDIAIGLDGFFVFDVKKSRTVTEVYLYGRLINAESSTLGRAPQDAIAGPLYIEALAFEQTGVEVGPFPIDEGGMNLENIDLSPEPSGDELSDGLTHEVTTEVVGPSSEPLAIEPVESLEAFVSPEEEGHSDSSNF